MATNNFLPFASTDTGTNLLTQSEYAAASDRTNGNQPGIASSKLVNKAVRQSAYITSQLAQFLANVTGADVLDDATPARLLAQIEASLSLIAPVVQVFTSTGTWNTSYLFFCASSNATTGATYTNNGVTYTVVDTIASSTILTGRGNAAPTVSGTLTKASGTGDATITFYAVRAPIAIEVTATGGGGGGGGAPATTAGLVSLGASGGAGGTAIKTFRSGFGTTQTVTIGAGGTAGTTTGGTGGTTTFSTLSATGGTGGGSASASASPRIVGGASSGTGSGGDINLIGGCSGSSLGVAATNGQSSAGGASYWGGGAQGTVATTNSAAGVDGTAYGSGGSGASNGTTGNAAVLGGVGKGGIVVVKEIYQ